MTGAIPGVTLNLVSAEPNMPLQLSVGADTDQATTAINAFVVAYNTLMTAINHQFAVDPTTNTEGPLGSDSSLRSLQSSLLGDVGYSPSKSGLVNLVSLGIKMNSDGTLTVGTAPDGRSLSQVMSDNPQAFQSFFQGASGFATKFNTDLTNLTSPTAGVLNSDVSQNNTEQNNLSQMISDFQDNLSNQKQQLIQQYSQVNATLEEYPYLLAEITSQLGNILPTSSNNTVTQGTSTS